jgi:hypothetical protein
MVTTLVGQGASAPFSDGIGTVATFFKPSVVALNSAGTFAVVVSVRLGVRCTCAIRFGGLVSDLRFVLQTCTRTSTLMQSDQWNHLIRAIDVTLTAVTPLAGRQGVSSPVSDGVGSAATFCYPTGVALNSAATLALVVGSSATMPLRLPR